MQDMGVQGESCPFSFNFDPNTFRVGDVVSYRVPDRFDDFPFVGILKEVHPDHVVISPNDPTAPDICYRASRESRPVVAAGDIFSRKGEISAITEQHR
ncbi:hypothetical protein IMCC21906_00977 [Spongiibacter sp. IMCC21906]|uniref:hypothetical protein n=1 Tax=Spongiibacter sp. IMCC21906 TaxID=1620392 RepID=UPI00062E0689|nr:hypothetical protein [Spongiibacter sp. IMCC21906]AKH68657.1 hypothetical protein IMCC21906_00977 [Spongiibacter sp. IMCC21906]